MTESTGEDDILQQTEDISFHGTNLCIIQKLNKELTRHCPTNVSWVFSNKK